MADDDIAVDEGKSEIKTLMPAGRRNGRRATPLFDTEMAELYPRK